MHTPECHSDICNLQSEIAASLLLIPSFRPTGCWENFRWWPPGCNYPTRESRRPERQNSASYYRKCGRSTVPARHSALQPLPQEFGRHDAGTVVFEFGAASPAGLPAGEPFLRRGLRRAGAEKEYWAEGNT